MAYSEIAKCLRPKLELRIVGNIGCFIAQLSLSSGSGQSHIVFQRICGYLSCADGAIDSGFDVDFMLRNKY